MLTNWFIDVENLVALVLQKHHCRGVGHQLGSRQNLLPCRQHRAVALNMQKKLPDGANALYRGLWHGQAESLLIAQIQAANQLKGLQVTMSSEVPSVEDANQVLQGVAQRPEGWHKWQGELVQHGL